MATKDRIFLSAGEASGDAYGAALVTELRRLAPERAFAFEGVGGRRLRAAGVRLVRETSAWGAISIVQSFKVGPRVALGYLAVRRRLSQGPPGLFIPIDFGFVNIRLARHAKSAGWKVLYFVPPGSWNRERQGRDLPAITDAISTPFSWSADLLRAAGANAHWFGHPLRQLVGGSSEDEARDLVVILPGSRRHEIAENLPLIAKAVKELALPSVEFGLAPTLNTTEFIARWRRLAPDRNADEFTQGNSMGVLRRARAAIVCSGTATLEAALCDCPMVVVYRVSRVMEWEAAIVGFRRPKFISLPNILLDRAAVPELVQSDATPEKVAGRLREILEEGPARDAQRAAFAELDAVLGPRNAITQTARLALSLLP